LRTDVLVIGGGVAGATAALAAAEDGASVLLLSKTELTETNTNHAQGGLAAVLAGDDSFTLHLDDTLRVGAGLTDIEIARWIIGGGPDVIRWLQAQSARFDCDETGALKLSREGGHSVERVVHANGDATGREMQRALAAALLEHPSIDVQTGAFVDDLLLSDSRCVGASVITDNTELLVEAGSTVLATGGAGQIYRETTNPIGACGDGVALGFRAGATVRDMEFVQFHPTTLYIAGASRFLISEVLRGAGGVLVDRDGIRFMVGMHESAELAPRDVVSRAILDRMVETGDTHVYLDLRGVDGDPHVLFPTISRICGSFDINVATDPVPVRPGAHYLLGGVVTDSDGRTDVPGLLAAGESASTGFHGANRLASNSLLEGAVLGRAAGVAAASTCDAGRSLPRTTPDLAPVENPPRIQFDDMLYSLKSLMWRQVGLQRSDSGLREALDRIGFWNHYLTRSGIQSPRACELANMLLVSTLVSQAASVRTESRGTHFRTDHPERDDADWCRHLLMRLDDSGSIDIAVQPVFTPTDRPPTHE
jgi:L-aspartate oxidase